MAIQLVDSDFKETSSSIASLQSPFAFLEETKETSNLLMVKGIKQFIDSWVSHIEFGYLGQEDRTRTMDVQIYDKYLYKFINIISWFDKKQEPKELKQEALLNNEFHSVLKNLFIKEVSDIPEVISVYVIYSRNVIDLWTIVESNLYEAEGKIIDLELKILGLFPNKYFDFLVLPKSSIDLNTIIPSKGVEIYTRK